MSDDATAFCRSHGLTYIDTTDLEFRRRRCGKGFAYLDNTGRTLRNKASKARIARLAIPPAWTDVRIAKEERAHIQAIGRDAEGRLQYRYHPDWETFRDATKAERLRRLGGGALPPFRSASGCAMELMLLGLNWLTSSGIGSSGIRSL
jgi:DNA topoisomerase-1